MVQARPQAPQLRASVCVLAQARAVPMPQHERPGAQAQVQRPTAQTSPAGQAVPQAPQLAESAWRLTQVPPQRVCPGRHTGRHAPLMHD